MSPKMTSKPLKCISGIYQNLKNVGGDDLRQRLFKWTRQQPLGWVFDNDDDLAVSALTSGEARTFGFDYTEFLDDLEVSSPILMYLLHIQELLINGDPFIFMMEECWKPLRVKMIADMVLDKQKTIRKQSGLGIFLTQSPADVTALDYGKTMVEQSNTCIYLPNPKADYDDYVKGFKVTEREYEIIRNLGETSRMFLIKQGHKSAIVEFNLGGMNELINILSGSTDNIAIFDQICDETGTDNPDVWMPLLQEKIRIRKANAKKNQAALIPA